MVFLFYFSSKRRYIGIALCVCSSTRLPQKLNVGYNFAKILTFFIKFSNYIACDNTDLMFSDFWGQGHICQFCPFLAHLSTKCSGWAIVIGLCPLSVVRRASCKLFYLNIFSSETAHWILTKLHRNDPWVVPYQSCSNGSDWLHK